MVTSNSSADDSALHLTSPGQRSGEGAASVLPYLHESLASRPAELSAADPTPKYTAAQSLANGVRRALWRIRKTRK
ncbi:MAG: hypothetical protein NDJ19_09225 [Ramlibacter sp.]|nr:hypothetical protein [Ramlibacter sp.]